jgi:hypothetical protein
MIRNNLHTNRDAAAVISGVDQRMRSGLQSIWRTLPNERKNWDELESNFRRLSERALRDFKEDMELFPTENRPG